MRLAFAWIALIGCAPEVAPRVSTHVDDWRDRVIYQVLVDRFANGDPSNDAASGVEPVPGDLARVQGGDWRGLRERLDYVQRLGMSAIWISPIYANVARIESEDGYHGYWPRDFTSIEERFGTLEELRALVREAHARGIAVIVDVVPNHTGRVFAYDLDADGEVDHPIEDLPGYRESAYEVPLIWSARPRLYGDGSSFELAEEHFHRRGIGNLGDYEQRRLGDFPTGLRDLDTTHEAVIGGMIETHVRWVLETDVDGFRIDAVPHADVAFWRRFGAGVRRRLAEEGKQRFFLLGEIFELDPSEIAAHTVEGALDAGFDFPLKYGFVDEVILGGAAPRGAVRWLSEVRSVYRTAPQPDGIGLDPWQARVAIVDNHDIPRVRGVIDDPFAVDQALVAIFTVDAIPAVYYGTEQELAGIALHDRRERMWDTGYAEDGPTFRLIQMLATIRRSSVALRRGTLVVRYASEVGGAELEEPTDDAGLVAWERAEGDERVLVVLGTHPTITARASLETGWSAGTRVRDALGEWTATVGEGGVLGVEVAARTSLIVVAE